MTTPYQASIDALAAEALAKVAELRAQGTPIWSCDTHAVVLVDGKPAGVYPIAGAS